MTGDLSTLYTGIRTALIATVPAAPSWGTKAFADFAPKNADGTVAVTRPYVVYGYSGGGDESFALKADPNMVVDVICVADSLAAALTGEEEIRQRIDDGGEQEAGRVAGNGQWTVKTVTRETRIHLVEQVSGTTQIYHSGARYRVRLEKR